MRRLAFLLIILSGLDLSLAPRVLFAQSAADSPFRFQGYFQTQYTAVSGDGRQTRDRIFFRRIVLAVQGDLADDWMGEVQVDIAPQTVGDRLIVRDTFIRYTGFEDRGIVVTLGNQKMPFSRSSYTSASRRALVERPFTGERAFGAPGRAIALKVDGRHERRHVQWSAAAASALHAPAANALQIDGLATADNDWNEGVLLVGRAEWHPFGFVPLQQSSFDVKRTTVTGAVATYYWRNDGDRNLYTEHGRTTDADRADLQDSVGFELSGALRAPRFSLDAEFHRVIGNTLDPGFTGGLYIAGHARLYKTSVEAGYMLIGARLEAIGDLDTLSADAWDSLSWRAAFGLNYYVLQHRLKFQFMQREVFNTLGVSHLRTHETFLQAQLVF